MKRNSFIGILAFLVLFIFTGRDATAGNLPRTTPEAEGIPSSVITTLFDSLMSLPDTEMQSIMVLSHGTVVDET